MLNIAIVDDEKMFQENLETMLSERLPKVGIRDYNISKFDTGEDFLKVWKADMFQMIFLDIYMPGINGVELAREIRKKDNHVTLIFSTTSNEFAAESYQVNARFYLRKPYEKNDIDVMINQIDWSQYLNQKKICFPDNYYCSLEYISYTLYGNHNVNIWLRNGDSHKVRMSQSELCDMLLQYEDFCQINQGTIINFDQVEKAEKTQVTMSNGEILPISRSNQKKTALAYSEYCYRQMRKTVIM